MSVVAVLTKDGMLRQIFFKPQIRKFLENPFIDSRGCIIFTDISVLLGRNFCLSVQRFLPSRCHGITRLPYCKNTLMFQVFLHCSNSGAQFSFLKNLDFTSKFQEHEGWYRLKSAPRTDARDLCTYVVINKSARGPGNRGLFPSRDRFFCSPRGCEVHPVRSSVVTMDCLNSGKAAVAWNWPYMSSKEA